MLFDRIAGFAARYAMFPRGATIGVAVSGGADSVCLLHVMRELAPQWNLRLHVLHLNHKLRGTESDGDAEFVRSLASGLDLPATIRQADVASVPGNLEQAARRARLEFFRDCMASGEIQRIALGHTRNDQAETVLFRFLRGAATAGLSGIRPVTEAGIVRPLLHVDRWETEAYLRDHGIPWRQDSSNADPRFARNRIRHQLLPQLIRDWNPALVETLAQTAEWAQGEESYWESELARIAPTFVMERDGEAVIQAAPLLALPAAAGRRLIRRAIAHVKGDLRAIDFPHVAAILRLARDGQGHGSVQVPGVLVTRSLDWLRFVIPGESAVPPGYRQAAPIPGLFRVPGSGLAISLELIEKAETLSGVNSVYNGRMGGLDWERLSGRLEFRNWQAGDRYQPSGSASQIKLKTLFQRARIPLWERRLWPVLTDGGSIVWVRQFGPAAQFEAKSGSRLVLAVRESAAPNESGIGDADRDV
jgi:tRNA(Ile)-lysidine synthase